MFGSRLIYLGKIVMYSKNKKITHLVAFNKRFREIMSHVKLRVYILFNQRKADCMKLTVHKADLNSSRRNDLLQIFQFSIVKRENFLHKIASWNFYLATSLSSKRKNLDPEIFKGNF